MIDEYTFFLATGTGSTTSTITLFQIAIFLRRATCSRGGPEELAAIRRRGVRGNDQLGVYVSEDENRDGGTLRIPSSRVRGSTSGGDLNDHNSSSHGQTRNGDHNRVEREREEPEGVAQRSRSAKGAADLC